MSFQPSNNLDQLIELALAEDVGPGDVTAGLLPEGLEAEAVIHQKAPGVIFGLEVAWEVFESFDVGLYAKPLIQDGEYQEEGPVMEISGRAASILGAERTALNFLGKLSGIATLTRSYAEAVKGTGVKLLDTRKTTPGFRVLEKQAVKAGGGYNHRIGLFDAVLLKENHLRVVGGVKKALELAERYAPPEVLIEVECASLEELEEALEAGARRVLLDNMDNETLKTAVKLNAGRAELEASGGITLDTIRAVAETGIDYISVGALTHSAPTLDLSLLIKFK